MKKVISFVLSAIMMLSVFSTLGISVFAAGEDSLKYTITNGEATVTGCDTAVSGKLTIPAVIDDAAVTSIGAGAFKNCTGLTAITIPEGVTSIGKSAFESCTAATAITVPNSVTAIGEAAFYRCSRLLSVNIPDGITDIAPRTFSDCAKLKTVTIPAGVKTIGYNAFYNCKVLNAVVIPEGVTTIGAYAFSCCSALKSVTIPTTIEKLDANAFATCTSLTEVTIPNDAAVASEFVFSGCSALTKINFADEVTEIGAYAFYNCKKLAEVSFPESITYIGDAAFFDCKALKTVTFANAMTGIAVDAFGNCNAITDVYYTSSNLRWRTVFIAEGNEALTSANIHYALHEHDYMGLAALAGSCEEDSAVQFVCECGESYTVVTPAVGHVPVTEIEAVAPTCTQDGHTAKVVCAICREVLEESEPIAAPGHHFDESNDISDEEGVAVYACECGETETIEVENNAVAVYNDEIEVEDNAAVVDDGNDVEDNAADHCSCNCHKSGISNFLWKIFSIFRRIFDSKNFRYCECGAAH